MLFVLGKKCNFAQNYAMKKWNILWMIMVVLGCSCKKETVDFEVYKEPKSVQMDSNKLFLKNPQIRDFYKHNEYYTVWVNETNREDLIEVLQNIDEEGLNHEKYAIDKLVSFNLRYKELSYQQKIEADLTYSDAFFRVVRHLGHGRVNPKKYYGDWEPYLRPIDYNQLLLSAVSDEEVKDRVASVVPLNAYYKGLKAAYTQYRDMPRDTLLPVAAGQTSKIKKRLHYLGDYTNDDFSGSWNEEAVEALKKFQKRHALTANGTVNTATLKALNVSKEERFKQIAANLERARWVPDSFGDYYVMVNLPEYKLFVYDHGNLVETHNVIIGKSSRKTPVLSSSFSNLVINPTWTVPPTILKNDLVPKASADRDYFVRNRMTIYNKSGKVVAPQDWDPTNAKNYRYVQTTGGNNSLGLIKFDFPNQHMVYLHDTNNRTMFGNTDRALSSGCVRVQNPFELAERILKMEGSAYDREKLDTMVARKKTQYISLKKQVNVYQLYWTAWKDDQGVQFRDDVYQLDKGLYKKITN